MRPKSRAQIIGLNRFSNERNVKPAGQNAVFAVLALLLFFVESNS